MIIEHLRLRINSILPGAVFGEIDEKYDSIDWQDHRKKPSAEEVLSIDPLPLLRAERESREAIAYLDNSDWQTIRHRDQKELGIRTTLTDTEFRALLTERQAARERAKQG